MKLCIKGGYVVNAGNGIKGCYDLLIEEGVITRIEPSIDEKDAKIIEAEGKFILPGLVDMHCHLREPGFEYKETIYSGTRAAAKGGFTSVACMANTNPVADHAAVISYIQMKAERDGAVRVYPIGAITKGLKGEELAEMGELKEAGAVALSDDGKPVSNSNLMRMAMDYARNFEILLISHCEDESLVNGGSMNEGYMSTVLGLKGITRAAEELMVSRELLLAETLNTRIHIAHVSTRGSVELIRRAKERGVKVTCETAPHYFSATDEWVETYDTHTKVNPPLRIKEDTDAIKQGLKDGTIDCIATDHAPHHRDEKEVEYDLAASGISGFETAFSLAFTHLVEEGILSLEQLVEKMSYRPAEILAIPAGELKPQGLADLTIIDPKAQYTIQVNEFISKGKNNPFNGHKVKGKIIHTMVGGRFVVMDGELIA